MSALTCDCQIYEICPSCAPSPEEFERVGALRDEVLKAHEASACLNTHYPEYGPCSAHDHESQKQGIVINLDDLTSLMELYCSEQPDDSAVDLRPLFLSNFIAWLRSRMKEKTECQEVH
jgi:hypothetical protein